MNHTGLDAEPYGPQVSKRWILLASIVIGVIVVAFGVWLVIQNTAGSPGAPVATPTSNPNASESTAPVAPTAPVPTPSPGTETVKPQEPGESMPQVTQPPIDLDEVGTATDGLSVLLAKIEAVEGESNIPGEVAGPALRITVEARNDSTNTIDAPVVVVNLYYGPDRIAGNPLLQPGGQPFSSKIDPKSTEAGVYVFSVPLDQRDDIQIEVNMLFESSVVLFHGAVS